jgi:pimeloyl-ACP methyl ester carboxylesterase
MIAGHSMGAKVSGVLARRAEDGAEALAGLRGVILLAGSPPGPEPMEEAKRTDMLRWFAGSRTTWKTHASDYIDENMAGTLAPERKARAVADLLRMHPAAWAAWLQHGSREDWAERIGVLRMPALILAGAADSALGEAAQRRLTAPHYASHRLVTLKGAAHLLPMEQPDEVAALIADHVETVRATA